MEYKPLDFDTQKFMYYYFLFNKEKDIDIINRLESIPTGKKATYIKQLIRKDIAECFEERNKTL